MDLLFLRDKEKSAPTGRETPIFQLHEFIRKIIYST